MNEPMTFSILPDTLLPLVDKFYRSHRSPMRVAKGATVWVAKQHDIIGALSLTAVEDGHWLTGLFVAPEWRGQAVAGRLLEQMMTSQTGPVWLFCHPDLTVFYQRASFIPCMDLPAQLADRLQRYGRTKTLVALTCRSRLGGDGVRSDAEAIASASHSIATKAAPTHACLNHPHSDRDPGTTPR